MVDFGGALFIEAIEVIENFLVTQGQSAACIQYPNNWYCSS